MADIDAELREVREAAIQRYRDGEKQYGRLDLIADKRDFLVEAEEELLDLINYATFEVVKIRRINQMLNRRLHAEIEDREKDGAKIESNF